MVGAARHFILQPMARTNHKFPAWVWQAGRSKGSEMDSTGYGNFQTSHPIQIYTNCTK